VFVANPARFLIVMLGDPAVESEERRSQAIVGALFESFVTPVRYVRYAPRLQIVLARDVLFKHII
jgi:hypothetical protein